MPYSPDIEARINSRFKDGARVRALLSQLSTQGDEERVVRCVLELSDGDYDSVAAWVKTANADCRNVIGFAEYDTRNVRKFNFTYPMDSQAPYSYKA
jgi:hypothetical protein